MTLTLERVAAAIALVAVWGNRYSVPPELAGANVVVTHRVGADLIAIHAPGGRVVAGHRLAPSGAHRWMITHPRGLSAWPALVGAGAGDR